MTFKYFKIFRTILNSIFSQYSNIQEISRGYENLIFYRLSSALVTIFCQKYSFLTSQDIFSSIKMILTVYGIFLLCYSRMFYKYYVLDCNITKLSVIVGICFSFSMFSTNNKQNVNQRDFCWLIHSI